MATEAKTVTNTNAETIRGKSIDEMKEALVELRKEEFELRMTRGTGQLSDTSRFKKIRREVARIKTILNEKAKQAS